MKDSPLAPHTSPLPPDRAYEFSVYRHLKVGSGDVYIDVLTRLNQRGELEVEQRFVNNTDSPVSFRCHLLAPDRRRQKAQVVGLGRGSRVNVYRLPDGEELIGTTLWLRADEIDGPRVLNYHFVAERQAPEAMTSDKSDQSPPLPAGH